MQAFKHGRTLGQQLRLTLNLWYELPALSMGFSVRPPPATWPIMALHVLGITCIHADPAQQRCLMMLRAGFPHAGLLHEGALAVLLRVAQRPGLPPA